MLHVIQTSKRWYRQHIKRPINHTFRRDEWKQIAFFHECAPRDTHPNYAHSLTTHETNEWKGRSPASGTLRNDSQKYITYSSSYQSDAWCQENWAGPHAAAHIWKRFDYLYKRCLSSILIWSREQEYYSHNPLTELNIAKNYE